MDLIVISINYRCHIFLFCQERDMNFVAEFLSIHFIVKLESCVEKESLLRLSI